MKLKLPNYSSKNKDRESVCVCTGREREEGESKGGKILTRINPGKERMGIH